MQERYRTIDIAAVKAKIEELKLKAALDPNFGRQKTGKKPKEKRRTLSKQERIALHAMEATYKGRENELLKLIDEGKDEEVKKMLALHARAVEGEDDEGDLPGREQSAAADGQDGV